MTIRFKLHNYPCKSTNRDGEKNYADDLKKTHLFTHRWHPYRLS